MATSPPQDTSVVSAPLLLLFPAKNTHDKPTAAVVVLRILFSLVWCHLLLLLPEQQVPIFPPLTTSMQDAATRTDASPPAAVAAVATSGSTDISAPTAGETKKRPAASSLRPSPTSTMSSDIVDLTISDDEKEEEDSTMELLYTLTTKDCRHLKIVGIRYYRGVAYGGEYVRLAREPSNPYDRNAIRVDNLRQEKVGHVAKEAAAILSPVWDRFGDQLVLDASIPWRGNHYSHPLQVEIRAPSSLWDTLRSLLEPLVPSWKREASDKPRAVSVTAKKVDWKQQQAQLDQLWKDLLEKQLDGLAEIPIPEALASPLFAHQRQALNWLVHRENSTDNPFFQETNENGKTVHLCQLTKSSQPQLPTPIRGGMLADGKCTFGPEWVL